VADLGNFQAALRLPWGQTLRSRSCSADSIKVGAFVFFVS
jgi:hypothetical protein